MNFVRIESEHTVIINSFTDEEMVSLSDFVADTLDNYVGKESKSGIVANRILHMLRQWEDETL